MMKVAVSSYSFSQAYRSGRITLFDSIAKAKEMGFEGFEVVDFNFKTSCPEGKSLEKNQLPSPYNIFSRYGFPFDLISFTVFSPCQTSLLL